MRARPLHALLYRDAINPRLAQWAAWRRAFYGAPPPAVAVQARPPASLSPATMTRALRSIAKARSR